MDRSVLRDVYGYWVGELASPTEISRQRIAMWMQQSDETDRVVREGYGHHVAGAAATDWDVEALTREEAVGLIVLLDQFPRNIHRTSGEAFAHDAIGARRRPAADRGRARPLRAIWSGS